MARHDVRWTIYDGRRHPSSNIVHRTSDITHRLHPSYHRRALYSILRHLPADRPDAGRALALAAGRAGAGAVAGRAGCGGGAVPALGDLRRTEASALRQSESGGGRGQAAWPAHLPGAPPGRVPRRTPGRPARRVVAGRAGAASAVSCGLVAHRDAANGRWQMADGTFHFPHSTFHLHLPRCHHAHRARPRLAHLVARTVLPGARRAAPDAGAPAVHLAGRGRAGCVVGTLARRRYCHSRPHCGDFSRQPGRVLHRAALRGG